MHTMDTALPALACRPQFGDAAHLLPLLAEYGRTWRFGLQQFIEIALPPMTTDDAARESEARC